MQDVGKGDFCTHQALNQPTFGQRSPIPPSDILDLLPLTQHSIIVLRTPLERTDRSGLTLLEEFPIHRRPGQIPPGREIRLPQTHHATFLSAVGKDDTVDLGADMSSSWQDVDAVEGVFGVAVDLNLFFVPCVQVSERDLDEAGQRRVKGVRDFEDGDGFGAFVGGKGGSRGFDA